MSTDAYRARTRSTRSQSTRTRIVGAVHELLAEGAFHHSTVEQVADRAGVARATLYQHFPSRLDLVDAICETLGENPALRELREVLESGDAKTALDGVIAGSIRFWSSEGAVLSQLYGVAAIDPAANDLVDRQRADRRGDLERLVTKLREDGHVRSSAEEKRAVELLLVLTSYDTFRELRAAGLSDRALSGRLQETARQLLL